MENKKIKIQFVCILLGAIGLLVGVMLWNFPAKERRVRPRCKSNLRGLGQCLALYAMDHNEEFPDSWSNLVPYASSPRIYMCDYSAISLGDMPNVDEWPTYIDEYSSYVLIHQPSSAAPDAIHAFCKSKKHGKTKKTNVMFADNSIEKMSFNDLRKALMQQGLTNYLHYLKVK